MADWQAPSEGPAAGVGASDAFAERQAPWSPEAEISVLGGMLIDAEARDLHRR